MGMNLVAVPPGIPPDTITLDLSGHAITTIEYDDFRNLTKLKTLLLGSNKINSVAPGAFSDLTSLTTLDLHGNDISAVTTDTFAGLTAVQDLYLGSNNLTRVPRGALRPLTNLISLTLTGNPLHCDCGVAWIVTFTPVETEDVACSSPPLLAGHKLSQLTPDQLGCVVPSVVAVSYQMSAYVDQSVLMSCTVEGAPAEDLVWLFEGVGIEEGGENVKVLSNGSLYIVGMKMELAGDYMCVSSNMAGTNSATISLLFLGVLLPQISVRPSHTHAFPGENVLLRCQGDQYTISYYWLHSGQLLVSSSHAQVVMETGLNITNVTREDSGVYTCVAVGNAGSVNASAILTVTGPLLSCEGVIDASTMDAIRSKVNFAFNHMDLQPVSSPHQLLRRLNLPDNGSIELLVAGDVFQEALEVVRASHTGPSEAGVLSLSECEVTLLAELSGCLQHGPTPDCSDTCYHTRYRSVDGSCNNWGQPRLGMTDSPFLRLLAPAYEDGLGRPVGWSGGLPSARAVSQSVIRAHSVESDADFTHMIMQIGQFLDHDIDLASGTPSDVAFSTGAMCDSHCDNSAPCFPIPVPDDDPRLTGECLPFTRSGGVCGTGPSSLVVGATPIWREQINAISSFMDGSQIYGSTSELAERLRDPQRRGWLLEGDVSPGGKPFLPFDEHSLILCDTGIHANRSACFLAGDVRVNEQVSASYNSVL
jgi:peroxidase